MKKLIVLAAAAIAIQAAPVAALERPVMTQSPMVLVELQASMKADLVLAERRMGWEIRDELQTQSEVLLQESLTAQVTGVAKLVTETATEWTVSSED